jgi:hypothetical protein
MSDPMQRLLAMCPGEAAAIERMRQLLAAGEPFEAQALWPGEHEYHDVAARSAMELLYYAIQYDVLDVFVRVISPAGDTLGEYDYISNVPDYLPDPKSHAGVFRLTMESVHVLYRAKVKA